MSSSFLSNAKIEIPKAIYGTAWKEDRTADLVELALSKGFRGIDTACQPKHYKEPLVGQGIERAYKKGLKREQLFIQTKFTPVNGQDPKNIPYDPSKPIHEQVLESFHVSKKNLNTNYIDSLVLHSPLSNLEKTIQAWQTLETIVATGELKQIGISNCYDVDFFQELFKNAEIKPSVLQNRFYRETNYDKDLREFCQENNVYYQCFWTVNANLHIWQHPVVLQLAEKYKKSPIQIYFRCLNQLNIYPLFGTTNPAHMSETLNLSHFSLDTAECSVIQKLGPF